MADLSTRFQTLHRLPALLAPLLLASCSLFGASDEDLRNVESVELFLSRASLGNAEFEHVKLTKGALFYECGKLQRGRYFPAEQEVVNLRASQERTVVREASAFFESYSEREWSWAPPGMNKDLTDPGEVKLLMRVEGKTVKVETSLDSIADARHRGERGLARVVRTMRGAAGGKLCGNSQFFGLGFTS
jgi:hypothetical protein